MRTHRTCYIPKMMLSFGFGSSTVPRNRHSSTYCQEKWANQHSSAYGSDNKQRHGALLSNPADMTLENTLEGAATFKRWLLLQPLVLNNSWGVCESQRGREQKHCTMQLNYEVAMASETQMGLSDPLIAVTSDTRQACQTRHVFKSVFNL